MSKNYKSLGTYLDKATGKYLVVIEDTVKRVVALDAKGHRLVWHPSEFTKRTRRVGFC